MAAPAPPNRAVPESLAGHPHWLAVQRIISSPTFGRAARLSSFLSYICERALLGNVDEISEQQIGIHVFGRAPDYDPAADNIVRGTARQLRQRLAVYYQEEGSSESVRIVVPRGGYVPVITQWPQGETQVEAVEPGRAIAEPKPEIKRTNFRWVGITAAIAVLAIVGIGAWRAAQPTPVERFWQLVFARDRKTFLVPGDSGVVMFQNLTRKTVALAEYASGSYRSSASSPKVDDATLSDLGSRRYTSFSDLKFATRLVRRREAASGLLDIRYARDLVVEDLKQSNAIIVGAPQGNPWADLFVRELNFTISSDEPARTLTVVNRSPRPGEPPSYTYSFYDPQQHAYGTIALIDNLDHSGKVLLVAGTTVAGLDAAADFLFNDSLMKPVVTEWLQRGNGAGRFELLVETSGVAANGSTVKLIAKRFA